MGIDGFVFRPLQSSRSPRDAISTQASIRLDRYQPGRGGVQYKRANLALYDAHDNLVGETALDHEADPYELLEEYRVCDLFPNVTWYIDQPFQKNVSILVDWRQNGLDCGGELAIEGLDDWVFSWEIVVSHRPDLFDPIPGYEIDICFPQRRFHSPRDIVLRRRLAQHLLDVCCGPQAGTFVVHKNDVFKYEINNFFQGRPYAENKPYIATLGRDIYQARRGGRTIY